LHPIPVFTSWESMILPLFFPCSHILYCFLSSFSLISLRPDPLALESIAR
jgi:hypothetical protein